MITPTSPGAYIEETPSGVRTIAGVSTSITAMVGRTRKGPVGRPVHVRSFSEYEHVFGGLWRESPLSYAVMHFFQNGGTAAVIVRLVRGAVSARWGDGSWIALESANLGRADPGAWGNSVSIGIDLDPDPGLEKDPKRFNLEVRSGSDGKHGPFEIFRGLSTDPASPRYFVRVLNGTSLSVRVPDDFVLPDPAPHATAIAPSMMEGGHDGEALEDEDYDGDAHTKRGFFALEDAGLFNLLYFPPRHAAADLSLGVQAKALTYCQRRRAMLIVDAPRGWTDAAGALAGMTADFGSFGGDQRCDAMVYFPWLRMADPLEDGRLETFPPGASIAGIIARMDANRGVWKAPAGTEVGLSGVHQLSYKLSDAENGQLTPLGLNCIRTMVPHGHIIWGARTLAGDDRFASEWKYIPLRRTALYIEGSLFRGLHWVVFEPNDEPLRAQIRLNVCAFMHNLFRQGAFQGSSPKEAYFVKCDGENNARSDIDRGIVTVTVGFAPLKPAEFVLVQVQQRTGRSEPL